MTVTHYIAHFTDSYGKEFVGQVYWDKLYRGQLRVSICPRIGPAMLDYPVWESSGAYRLEIRAEMDAMVKKLKSAAKKMDLNLKSERLTEFAPPVTRDSN